MEESEYSMGMWDVIALDNALFESIVREMGLQSGITTTYEGKVYDISTAWVIDRSSPMRGRTTLADALVRQRGVEAKVAIFGALSTVRLEQRDGLGEERILRHAAAGAVLRPLMRPEVFVGIARLARGPILLHVRKSAGRELRGGEHLRSASIARRVRVRP